MIFLLYKIPIKLRLVDVENLANDIQTAREEYDKELEEYITYLKTYIKE